MDLGVSPVQTALWPLENEMTTTVDNFLGKPKKVVEELSPKGMMLLHFPLVILFMFVRVLNGGTPRAGNPTPKCDLYLLGHSPDECKQRRHGDFACHVVGLSAPNTEASFGLLRFDA